MLQYCVTTMNKKGCCIFLNEEYGKLAYNSLLVHNAVHKDKQLCKAHSVWENLIIVYLLKNQGGKSSCILLNQLHLHSEKLVTAASQTCSDQT